MIAPGNKRTSGIIAIVMILGATVLGVFVAGDNVLAIDWRLSRWIQQWQGNIPEVFYRLGDMLGSTISAIIVVVGLVLAASVLRSTRFVAFLVVVGVFRLIATILKPIFDSPRPTETLDIQPEVRIRIYEVFEHTGYPSGHSMTAAMIATLLVVIIWSTMRNRLSRLVATVLSVGLMLLVGWSRIWGGAHWPTDVLGGWSYGIGLVMLAWVITTPFAAPDSGQERAPAPE